MENLNLDCDSYNVEELERLFHLKKPYTQNDILGSKQRLSKNYGVMIVLKHYGKYTVIMEI